MVQMICPSPSRYMVSLAARMECNTGLDIGCGARSLLSVLRTDQFVSTGIDASEDMLKQSRLAGAHDEYVHADFLIWKDSRKFDVVVLWEVIEHFTKEDGFKVLERAAAIANKLVYVETPNGFLEQLEVDDNPFQKHLSGWPPNEFRKRGYDVFGAGFKGLRGQVGTLWMGMERLIRLIERLTRWYVFRSLEISYAFGAMKRI